MTYPDLIQGRGGGGKSGKGGGSAANDASNTLRSRARGRMVVAVSEGPIEGLVEGPKSIYRDKTPVQAQDGTYNIDGVIWEEHKGLPDDTPFKGHDDVGTIVQVDAELSQEIGPVIRTVVEEDADAVRVVIRVNALFRADKDDGSLKTNSVSYSIDVRPAGGNWVEALRNDLNNQKCTSPTQIAHRIPLPMNGAPWDIRVRRNSADESNDRNQSGLVWDSYVVLVEGRFTYPHTAAVALEFDAEEVGGNIGEISFKVKGRLIEVPTNYDPETRTYSGIWDGTFKTAWTNNPAWIFRDIIVNDRFGLGEFVEADKVNKWSLYTIAQYCDELIPSGYKDASGNDILEPRFTFNGVIKGRQEAFDALRRITAIWRGMGYWSLGQVFATADMPADPKVLVTPANVIDGDFEYSTTATKARHSTVLVRWSDPNNFYQSAIETVIDNEQLARFGWREKSVELLGCTSRAQAHRYGRWILDTEKHETETVVYRASIDHIDVVPGDIIQIADPRKQGVRMGGRIVAHDETGVTLDAAPEFTPGETYTLHWVQPNMQIGSSEITAQNEAVVTLADTIDPANFAQPDAMYVITGTDAELPQYRVLSVNEAEESIYQVTALRHDPDKYARVERDIQFEEPPQRPERTRVPEPTNLTVVETNRVTVSGLVTRLTVSWTAPTDTVVRGFVAAVENEGLGKITLPVNSYNSAQIDVREPGDYTFSVQTIDGIGRVSKPSQVTYTVKGQQGFNDARVVDLGLAQGGTTFTGRDVRLSWRNEFPTTTADGATDAPTMEQSPLFSHSIVEVYRADTGELLRLARVTAPGYTYEFSANRTDNQAISKEPCRELRFVVRTYDINNGVSQPSEVTVSNPPPVAPVPTIETRYGEIIVRVPSSDEEDVTGIKVWIEGNNTFNPALTEPKYTGSGGFFRWEGESDTQYYLVVGAFDSFGDAVMNTSPYYPVMTGKTVQDEIDENLVSAGGIQEVPALPADNAEGNVVFLTTDRKIYVWDTALNDNAGGWKTGVSSADVIGQIVADQLAAGSVGSSQLATEAVTADKMAANSVLSASIAAGAVTADKMSVNDLSAITATIGTFKTAPSGERTEISDQGIRIYNANGDLIMAVGDLTGIV